MTARSYAYDLGRARGACYGRAEPTERDWEWLYEQPQVPPEGCTEAEEYDFNDGMLDGRDQMIARRLGTLGSTVPPSQEQIAAARDKEG